MAVIDRRIGLLFGGFILLLLAALGRATYLGLFQAGALQQAAFQQQVSMISVPAQRGMITDRDGVVLALSESADEVIADPLLIKHPDVVAARLAPLLGQPELTVISALSKPGGFSYLAYDLPAARATEIMNLRINGISTRPVEQRVYPRGSTAAQVLGWVGTGNDGLAGIEYRYNNILRGRNGTRRVVNDAVGQPISVDDVKPMVPGKTIALTIDAPLQAQVEKVLAGIGAAYSPKGATAIVTDPQTDQILALANWPTVNANDIGASPQSATEDQAVGMSYEPGSTFKAFTVSGALQDGLITPSTVFTVPPELDPYGMQITDAEAHGTVDYTTAQILKYSSNIGADLIGQKMGADNFGSWVDKFGFGRPTGVGLPGEQQGVFPTVSQYSGVSMYNLPFGQGGEVTPMQMVQAYDAIADGGVLRTPQIVESIGGKKVRAPAGTRIISPNVAWEVRKMLRGVLADGGTASGAAIPGYDLAGKTGTAQLVVGGKYSNNDFVASFIGMVPASDPKLVVAVVVNDVPDYGGTVAAPAFQKIVGWAVPYFGINPCPSPCPASATNPSSATVG
jgi:cell division protein FtsI (penicillin-binding protein 3)